MITTIIIFRVFNFFFFITTIICANNEEIGEEIFLFNNCCDLCKRNKFLVKYQEDVWNWLNEINKNLQIFNSLSAQFTWDISIGDGQNEISKAIDLFKVKNEWKNQICSVKINYSLLNRMENRMLYLLCRGPSYSPQDSV